MRQSCLLDIERLGSDLIELEQQHGLTPEIEVERHRQQRVRFAVIEQLRALLAVTETIH